MNLSCAANHLCRLQDSASHLPFNCVVCHSGVHAQCCTNVVNNGISLAGIVVCLLCTANANANATNANANANANAQPVMEIIRRRLYRHPPDRHPPASSIQSYLLLSIMTIPPMTMNQPHLRVIYTYKSKH